MPSSFRRSSRIAQFVAGGCFDFVAVGFTVCEEMLTTVIPIPRKRERNLLFFNVVRTKSSAVSASRPRQTAAGKKKREAPFATTSRALFPQTN
jgi:hypothetical protein